MTGPGAPPHPGRAGVLGARARSWAPAVMSAAASVLVTLASLLIARLDGFGTFGMFVALQAIGVTLGIPMLWGVHVNASRAMAARPEGGAVIGTALVVVAGASGLTTAVYAGLLALAGDIVPVAARGTLWHAAGLGASIAMMYLAESLLRIRGRQLLASGLRLGCAVGYLLAVVAVLAGGGGDASVYAVLVTGSNAACAALMLAGLRRASRTGTGPGTRSALGWDAGLARVLLREGRTYSTGQSLLHLLFGFDVILLMQTSGPAAVAVYALYVGSCRRVIGVLFTDSLASLLIASLTRKESTTTGRVALRYTPRLLALAGVGSSALVLVGLAAADGLRHLVSGWVALTALGCSAHALVVVAFCIFTVQPLLGLDRVRTVLTAVLLPGLALQWVGSALGGVPGMMIAFAVLNVGLAWWFLAVIRRALYGAGQRPEPAVGEERQRLPA